MSARIEVLIVCTDDENPDATIASIPSGILTHVTVARDTRPCSTPRIVNDAMARAVAERGHPWLWVVVHPDVVFGADFFGNLTHWAVQMERGIDPKYGVIGVMGVRLDDGKKVCVGHLWDRTYEAGMALDYPCIVDTLDEVCIVLRGDRPWTLDDSLGTYHLWASELCLSEKKMGRRSYVLPGLYITHNSTATAEMSDPYFYFNLGVLSERYRERWQTLLTPSGAVYDNRDSAGVRLI